MKASDWARLEKKKKRINNDLQLRKKKRRENDPGLEKEVGKGSYSHK